MRRKLLQLALFFYSPLILTYWFIVRPKTTGVKCVVKNGNQIALVRTSYGAKLWSLPGGGVKRNETLEEAAIREVKEEIGIDITNLKKHGSLYWDGEYKRNTVWVFSANAISTNIAPNSFEIEEVGWFTADNLPKVKSHLLTKFLEIANCAN